MKSEKVSQNDLRERIGFAIKKIGGQKAASLALGISIRSISSYMTGDAEPKLLISQRLAELAGVSLDWLATGEGSFNKNADMLDKKELILAIETVEESLNATNRTLKPAKKAELILAIYDLFTSENKPSSAQIISILSKIA